MSAENNWNPATVGLIQSSFFWGYLLTQVTLTSFLFFFLIIIIIMCLLINKFISHFFSTWKIAGGIWADTVGGKKVLGFGVIWWSVATILTPVAAKVGLPFLLVVRAFMGIGEVSCLATKRKKRVTLCHIMRWVLVKLIWCCFRVLRCLPWITFCPNGFLYQRGVDH